MRTSTILLLAAVIGFEQLVLPSAGRIYCSKENGLSYGIGKEPRVTKYLIPEFEPSGDGSTGVAADNNTVQGACSWKLILHSNEPRYIILDVITRTSLDEAEKRKKKKRLQKRSILESISADVNQLPPILTVTLNANTTQLTNVSLGWFTLILMMPQHQLNVTVSGHRVGWNSDLAIRAVTIDPGYCAEDMTLYQGRCFYGVKSNLSMQDALEMISRNRLVGVATGLQLASFGNRSDLRGFLNSNVPSKDVYPTKHPLDFSNPMRFGLLRSKDGTIIRFAKIGSDSCKIVHVTDFKDFVSSTSSPNGFCGTLQFNESFGEPLIEFADCQKPMLILISFPDAPMTANATGSKPVCGDKIKQWMCSQQLPDKSTPWSSLKVVVTVLVPVLMAAVAIGCWILKRRNNQHNHGMNGQGAVQNEDPSQMTLMNDHQESILASRHPCLPCIRSEVQV